MKDWRLNYNICGEVQEEDMKCGDEPTSATLVNIDNKK